MNLKTIQQEYQHTLLMADPSNQEYPKVLEAANQKYKQDTFTYKQGSTTEESTKNP